MEKISPTWLVCGERTYETSSIFRLWNFYGTGLSVIWDTHYANAKARYLQEYPNF